MTPFYKTILRSPRPWVQGGFLALCLFLGVQFHLFVQHFETGGQAAAYLRPPGVEAFLPVGALVSLKHWLANGIIDPVHPAALILLMTFLIISLLARRAFCSWICPMGTISELLWRAGRRLFGRNFRIWIWLDIPLRLAKYALLLFFVKLILLDMPAAALGSFLASPYWAISDVKMLYFFREISLTAFTVVALLTGLSLLYPNAWCRYLCPYGALLALAALAGPLRIHRDPTRCSACGRCGRRCPSRLPVDTRTTILSPECTGCLTCVDGCPQAGALTMALPGRRGKMGGRAFAVLVIILFVAGVGTGRLSGHWQTSLSYQDYQRLVPLVKMLK